MREKIIESLKQVIYPNFEKDIVTFGFLSHIDVKSDMAYLKITIPSSNEEVIQTIHADIIEKTKHLGLAKIDIDIIGKNRYSISRSNKKHHRRNRSWITQRNP